MSSKIYIAIILTNYQELNLRRYINYFQIKDEIILLKLDNDKINKSKFTKNVKKISFKNKYTLLIYAVLIIIKNLPYKKKFIFGNIDSRISIFLRKFIIGKDQIFVDDGCGSLHVNFSKLKKDSTVFTIYNIKLPSKLKKIQYFPKNLKKKKKICPKVLFIGSDLVSSKVLSRDKFIKLFDIIKKKNDKFYYYPHRAEVDELLLLPKNFKILKRKNSVEEFIFKYKYDFKRIYSFFSSSLFEIILFSNKKKITTIDIYNKKWIYTFNELSNYQQINKFKKISKYIEKMNLKILKL